MMRLLLLVLQVSAENIDGRPKEGKNWAHEPPSWQPAYRGIGRLPLLLSLETLLEITNDSRKLNIVTKVFIEQPTNIHEFEPVYSAV